MSTLISLTESRDDEILTQENFEKYATEIFDKFGYLAEMKFREIYGPQVGKVPKTPTAQ